MKKTNYKVLKSVVHNFGHSFTSLMNYFSTDYALGHIQKRMKETNLDTLHVDIINKEAKPKELLTTSINFILNNYYNLFPSFVERIGSSTELIKEFKMTIKFDFSKSRTNEMFKGIIENPYTCHIILIDDRDKEYIATFSDWWYPEYQ